MPTIFGDLFCYNKLCSSCQVGKDNVSLALSLVGYDEEVKAAMAYVFGTTFVCDGMDNAKKVKKKTFSLEVENKTYEQQAISDKNGFILRLALKQRHKGTRK